MEPERCQTGNPERAAGEGVGSQAAGDGCAECGEKPAFLEAPFLNGCTFNLLKSALGAEVGSCPECGLESAVRFQL